ncbi:hypothetical protein DFH07DRAFT_1055202 [Mycena maculata]|uniref:Uncharacterized protein n=1 Tax=Mycena maculata TaxID=230809 RepID=A0AAD7NZX0_9AGAR|nr:hypothetical protein DFH07DRAFT_1055202 [Mycena maculata]
MKGEDAARLFCRWGLPLRWSPPPLSVRWSLTQRMERMVSPRATRMGNPMATCRISVL